MAKLKHHWTDESIDDFVYSIASDFVLQLEKKIEEGPVSQAEIAKRIGVSEGRVSQVLNDPGNLTLRNTVRYARALGMKISLIAYADGDPANEKGPVNSEIFTTCWTRQGAPKDFFELNNFTGVIQQIGVATLPTQGSITFLKGSEANFTNLISEDTIKVTQNSGVNPC